MYIALVGLLTRYCVYKYKNIFIYKYVYKIYIYINCSQIFEMEVSSDEATSSQTHLTKAAFASIFDKSVDKATKHIESDKLLNISKSKFGSKILEVLSYCVSFNFILFCREILLDEFYSLFSKTTVTSLERERLFSKFHIHVRSNAALQNKFIEGLKIEIDSKIKFFFYQKLLDSLLECIFNELLIYHTSRDAFNSYKVSDSEQQVLFYIAGFILRKLEGFTCNVLSSFKDIILSFNDKNTDSLGLAKEWTLRLDRGGLKYPCNYLFLLIKEIDFCVNSNVNIDNLNSQSLCLKYLLPVILESYMVKYYFKMLTEKIPCTDCHIILKYILKVFITVKGFALAKRARIKLVGKCTSSSLRGSLKK